MTAAHEPRHAPDDRTPALLPGLTFVSTDRGLAVRGGPRSVLLPLGLLPRTAQPNLAEVFASSITVTEASQRLGCDAEQLVVELGRADLLDRSSDDGFDRTSAPGRYYRRVLGALGTDGADEHARRLAAASVVLVGAFGGHGRSIREQLNLVGVGDVLLIDEPSTATELAVALDTVACATRRLAVVDCSEEVVTARCRPAEVATRAAKFDVPVLYSALGSGHLLGPLTVVDAAPCPDCIVRSLHEVAADATDATDTPDAPDTSTRTLGAVPDAIAAVAAARIANEVCRVLGDTPDRAALMTVVRSRLDQTRSARYGVLSYPDCHRCGSPGAETGSTGSTWSTRPFAAVEAAAQLLAGPPGREAAPMSLAEVRARWATARERGRWESRPTTAAEPLASAPWSVGGGRGPVDTDAALLVRLVRASHEGSPLDGDGSQPPDVPAYGAVQPFVVSTANPFRLPGSVFRFDHDRDAVEAVGAEDRVTSGSEACNLLRHLRTASSAAIVLTATVSRLARDFPDTALRLAWLEVGAAVARLGVAADVLDCEITLVPVWDESLYRLLALSADQDAIAAVLEVTGPDTSCL